jgi:polygalacturonase
MAILAHNIAKISRRLRESLIPLGVTANFNETLTRGAWVLVVLCEFAIIESGGCSSDSDKHQTGTGVGGVNGMSGVGGANGISSGGSPTDSGTPISDSGTIDAATDSSTDAAINSPCAVPRTYNCVSSAPIPSTDCDVTDFGAIGDGTTDDTCAVQAAIDYCAEVAKCYGAHATVHVPPGTYSLLPLVLRSNLTLQLDGRAVDGDAGSLTDAGTAGLAILQFVGDPNRYQSSGGLPIVPGLINGTTVSNVTITGSGIIDGAGAQWWSLYSNTWQPAGVDPRPYLIFFQNNSSNITISGVLLQNSPKFHVFFQNCTNIDVHGIIIRAPSNSPNTDGIDPKSCTHVSISDCDISTGDDNVAISSNARAGFAPPTSNYTEVHNCRFGAGHGVSIGSPTYGDIGGMNVHDCTFDGTQNGIRIKSNATSGGVVDGIVYNNLQLTNVSNVIVLDGYYSDKANIPPLDGGVDDSGVDASPALTTNEPEFRNIRISNLTATNCGSAGIIRGRIESPISNVVLENVNIAATTGMTIRFAEAIQFINASITTPAGTPPLVLQVDPSQVTGI